MDIQYFVDKPVTAGQFIDLLHRSTLAERRPVADIGCMQGMLDRGDLCITAWRDEQLVGIARSVTDFHYCCYLSDLAVDVAWQHQGVGRQLQKLTLDQLESTCKLILVAAPAADDYYGRFGYERNPRCWILPNRSAFR